MVISFCSMTKESYGAVYFKEPCLDTYKIYVGNLAPETTDQDLRSKFEKYGPVIEASALPGKGFGFVVSICCNCSYL